MQNENETLNRVGQVLVREFEIEDAECGPDTQLYDELGLDSLDSVDLVVALEKEFGFKVNRTQDEERIRAIRSVQDICDFIRYKQQGGDA